MVTATHQLVNLRCLIAFHTQESESNLDTINGSNRLLPHYTCAILAHMVLGIYVGIGVEKNACCFHTALRSRKMEWRTIFLEEIIARVRVHFAKMAFAKAKAQS